MFTSLPYPPPLVGRGQDVAAAACLLVAADIAVAWWAGAMSLPFLVVNNDVLLIMIVGIANMWARGGMCADG